MAGGDGGVLPAVLIRGGGDLATGVALRLHRVGIPVLVTELARPLVVRRGVSVAQAIFSGEATVEEVAAVRVADLEQAREALRIAKIPVLVDPQAEVLGRPDPDTAGGAATCCFPVLIDARLTKRPPQLDRTVADLVIGLGPGFIPNENCHAVVETMRGHHLGRVLWDRPAAADTRIPEGVGRHREGRVLRAPVPGPLRAFAQIGDRLVPDQLIAAVDGVEIRAPFQGVLRGLIHESVPITAGMKVGDLDPRDDPAYCWLVSDKSLAVGGGVLEAVLSRPGIRRRFFGSAQRDADQPLAET